MMYPYLLWLPFLFSNAACLKRKLELQWQRICARPVHEMEVKFGSGDKAGLVDSIFSKFYGSDLV